MTETTRTGIPANRPRSLREAASHVLAGRPYASSIKEFVDEIIAAAVPPSTPDGFYLIGSVFYEEEPGWLDNPVYRAHLAGMAENLATLCGQLPPEWSERKIYFLQEPAFFGGPSYRQLALRDTPAAFRRRLLFCGPSLDKLFRLKPRAQG